MNPHGGSTDAQEPKQFFLILWAIWHARRKAIHEDIWQSPISTMMFVERFLSDLALCDPQKPTREITQRQRPKKAGKWIALSHGRAKLNVDAAVAKTTARGAVGVVCRSAQGLYLGASAVVFEGITHPGCLEAMACREALDLAMDLQLDAIQVASDCLEVVKGLHTNYLGVFGNIVREIKERAQSKSRIFFCHERREHNEKAHLLAWLASTLPAERHVWLLGPPGDLDLPVMIQTE
jgi:ribonuclease HI